jgi:hypothetical protein
MKNSITFFITVSVAALLSACSSSTETAPTQANHRLKTGDTFTYHEYETDLDSNLIDGTDTTVIATVIGTDLTVEGRTDVAEIHGSDTIDIAVESDSLIRVLQRQVDIFPDVSIPAVWVPFDTHIPQQTVHESTQNTIIQGMASTVKIKIDAVYLGNDSVEVSDKKLFVERFSKIVTVVVSVGSFGDVATTVTVTYSYSPLLGYFAGKNERTYSDSPFSPVPNGTTQSKLIDYLLK